MDLSEALTCRGGVGMAEVTMSILRALIAFVHTATVVLFLSTNAGEAFTVFHSSPITVFSRRKETSRAQPLSPSSCFCPELSRCIRHVILFEALWDADMGSTTVGFSTTIDLKYGTGAAALALLAWLHSQIFVPKQLASAVILDRITEGTFLANKRLTCVYKASRDGWSAIDFHNQVDGRGSAVVVARSRSGKTFGGFNPNGWRSTDDYYDSSSAFLWSGTSATAIAKFPVLAGGNAAIFDYATGGPCFGNSDLLIGPPKAAIMGGFAGPDMENTSTNAGNLRQAKASPGITYDGDARWPVLGDVSLLEVEVYCNAAVGQQRASW